jgi:thiamine-monophosphate kinase
VVPSIIGTEGYQAGVPMGIGDDAMVLRGAGRRDWVVTVDAFVESVHFWADRHPADSVGYKALARATSDLAAMGATPRYFLLALGLPPSRAGKWLDRMLVGMKKAARVLGLNLVGGDTTRTPTVSMNLTVIGDVVQGQALTRAGARAGDAIFVSGPLGRAQLGLELIRRGAKPEGWLRTVLAAHLYPRIRIELGAWLATHGVASAAMDISDGLSSDLVRLCAASGVGAAIYEERIPCAEIPAGLVRRFGRNQRELLKMALHGGDDYELLFTVPKRKLKALSAAPGFRSLRAIGEIHRGEGVSLVDARGRDRQLTASGWDPFRGK